MRSDRWLGYALLLPYFVALGGLFGYPMLYAFQHAFYAKGPFDVNPTYVGLDNFFYFFQSPAFWHSLRTSVVFACGSVALQMVIGTGIGLLLNQAFRGRSAVRGFLLFPYMVPIVVTAIAWKWLLDPRYGLFNYYVSVMAKERISFFSSPLLAMITLMIISGWQFFPFVTINVLARLQVIPTEVYEAAKVDGASAFQRFIYIIIPYLKYVFFLVLLLRGIWMFNKFDIVWLLTGGGPAKATRNLPVFTYEVAFKEFQLGKGSTLAVVTVIPLALVSFFYIKYLLKEE